jgi:lipopolysaccharide/colanic/teichoic acid biosynthesis glycosyltransferase
MQCVPDEQSRSVARLWRSIHADAIVKNAARLGGAAQGEAGLTGLAQVNRYRGEIGNLEKVEKRVEYDLECLRRWTLRLDLAIIVRTVLIHQRPMSPGQAGER